MPSLAGGRQRPQTFGIHFTRTVPARLAPQDFWLPWKVSLTTLGLRFRCFLKGELSRSGGVTAGAQGANGRCLTLPAEVTDSCKRTARVLGRRRLRNRTSKTLAPQHATMHSPI